MGETKRKGHECGEDTKWESGLSANLSGCFWGEWDVSLFFFFLLQKLLSAWIPRRIALCIKSCTSTAVGWAQNFLSLRKTTLLQWKSTPGAGERDGTSRGPGGEKQQTCLRELNRSVINDRSDLSQTWIWKEASYVHPRALNKATSDWTSSPPSVKLKWGWSGGPGLSRSASRSGGTRVKRKLVLKLCSTSLRGKVKLLRLGWTCAVSCVRRCRRAESEWASETPETSDYLPPGPVVKCRPSEKRVRVVWPEHSDIICWSCNVYFFSPP